MAFWVETQARKSEQKPSLDPTDSSLLHCLPPLLSNINTPRTLFWGCARVDPSEIAGLTSATQRWRNFVTVRGSSRRARGIRTPSSTWKKALDASFPRK